MTASLRAVLTFFVLTCAAFGQLEQFNFGEEKADQVKPSLVADTSMIVAGKPFTVLVRLELKEGWHVYWQFGGDAGSPPKATWTLPEGFTADPIQWPVPKAYVDEGDLLTYIYEGEALLPVVIHPPATLPAGDVTLKARLSWLVCEKVCLPGSGDVSLTLPVGPEAKEANVDLFKMAKSRLPRTDAPPFKVTWKVQPTSFTVEVAGVTPDTKLEFFPLPPSGVRPGAATISEPDPKQPAARTIQVPVKSGGEADTPWRGLLVAGKTGTPASAWILESSAAAATASNSTPSTQNAAPIQAEPPKGLIAWLFSAFIGGMVLNLMPCVLPVIALKIFGFVNQAGEDPKRVFRLGLSFVAGVFVFFLGLAAVAIYLGKKFFWGMHFEDPRVVLGLTALVVLFTLSMFGVFEITLGGTTENAIGNLSRKEGYSGAFLHGLFTTLLGTSCTAPFLGPALGFAVKQPPTIIVTFFLAMAAGLSLPYFLLTWQPAWLRFIPKPGPWMERFKQLMGFVLLGVVIWLLGIYGSSRGDKAMTAAAWLMAFLSLASWIFGVGHRSLRAIVLAVAVLAIGAKFFLADALRPPASRSIDKDPEANSVGIVWTPFTPAKVEEAIAGKQPVFIDFTADWCANCKTNESLFINTNAVAAAFKEKKVLTVKADWTSFDPVIGEWIKKYDRIGVPVYVLYRPGEAAPVVFPELLSQKILLEEIGKIR